MVEGVRAQIQQGFFFQSQPFLRQMSATSPLFPHCEVFVFVESPDGNDVPGEPLHLYLRWEAWLEALESLTISDSWVITCWPGILPTLPMSLTQPEVAKM